MDLSLPPSSLVLGIRPGGQDPSSQWERERSARLMPPLTWGVGSGERGTHLLVAGAPGSGYGTFCDGLLAQAIEQGQGVVLFEISDRFERGEKVFAAASACGRAEEVEVWDWSGLEKAHETFRRPLVLALQARKVVLVSLPDSDHTVGMLWGALDWLTASDARQWKEGNTVLFWPEIQWTFDGLRHRLACSRLAERKVSTLFHSSRLEGLRNHGGDWWHNLLEPLTGLVLFRNELKAPVLDTWNQLKGQRQGPQAYPDSLDLRWLPDKQAWMDMGQGWEQVRAFQPTRKSASRAMDERFLELVTAAAEEARKAPYIDRALMLDTALPITEAAAPRARL